MSTERMSDLSFALVADGIEDNEAPDSAPAVMLREARRARSEEARLRQAVEIEKARGEEYLKTIEHLRERVGELETSRPGPNYEPLGIASLTDGGIDD